MVYLLVANEMGSALFGVKLSVRASEVPDALDIFVDVIQEAAGRIIWSFVFSATSLGFLSFVLQPVTLCRSS
jgi:hypothetical protein